MYVFGSVAEGCAHPLSDLDFGIVFRDLRKVSADSFVAYNQLYDLLTDAFPDTIMDIVFLQLAGLEICSDAIRHGRLLFASSEDARYEFEERVMILYADFKPHLDNFNEAVLQRI
ncbi:MAG: nucleotidyltransferase domain-containing protein [Acidobacteriia bacterium]|nr:nucleotidyltransferase domain-containing protein [Terriglobia bacterium]